MVQAKTVALVTAGDMVAFLDAGGSWKSLLELTRLDRDELVRVVSAERAIVWTQQAAADRASRKAARLIEEARAMAVTPRQVTPRF